MAVPAGRVRLGPKGLSLAHLQAGQDRAQEVSYEARTRHAFYCPRQRWKPCRRPMRPVQRDHSAAIDFCAPPTSSAALRQPCRPLACFPADRALECRWSLDGQSADDQLWTSPHITKRRCHWQARRSPRRQPHRACHKPVTKPMSFRFDGPSVRVSFSVKAFRHE